MSWLIALRIVSEANRDSGAHGEVIVDNYMKYYENGGAWMMGGDANGQKNIETVPGFEKGAGTNRPGNRALAGTGGEYSNGDGKGHRIKP